MGSRCSGGPWTLKTQNRRTRSSACLHGGPRPMQAPSRLSPHLSLLVREAIILKRIALLLITWWLKFTVPMSWRVVGGGGDVGAGKEKHRAGGAALQALLPGSCATNPLCLLVPRLGLSFLNCNTKGYVPRNRADYK